MINLIYESFPYGSSEKFVEYEIPYVNRIAGDKYRIFSFYRGHRSKRNIHLDGKLYIVVPKVRDYILGALTIKPIEVFNELKAISKRVCADPIVRCLWRMTYYRAYAYAFYRAVKKIENIENDIFVSYWLTECAYAAVMLKKWYPGILVTSRGHGFDVYDERCYLPYRSTIFSKIDSVFTVNEVERKYILEKHKEVYPEKIKTFHLGINLPCNYTKEAERTPFRIITCSSIIQLKRLDLLIYALAEIDEIEFEWYHIGDGPLYNQISDLASKKLNKKNQKFSFLGQLSLSEVHEYYKNHDLSVFINCSDTEGIPVSIMEAMSYGIPVIARNIGGNSEIVGNDTGLLIDSEDDPGILKEAILKIYSLKDDEYYMIRENARRRIENSFNAERQYETYFSLLQNMNLSMLETDDNNRRK